MWVGAKKNIQVRGIFSAIPRREMTTIVNHTYPQDSLKETTGMEFSRFFFLYRGLDVKWADQKYHNKW